MAQRLSYTFRLFGGRKGQNMTVNGNAFRNGICTVNIDPKYAAYAMRLMSFYGAFAEGTPEYNAYLAQEEAANGISVDPAPGAGSGQADSLHDGSIEAGGSAPLEAAAHSGSDVESEGGHSGLHPHRDGHEDARVSKFSLEADRISPQEPQVAVDAEIKVAVEKLDSGNNAHWTGTGLPRLSAVEDALGRAGVTRDDVHAALPGYTREVASL